MTGAVVQIAWILGKATAEISGDNGKMYVHLCDSGVRLWAGHRVKFAVKESPTIRGYSGWTPESTQDQSVPEAIDLEVIEASSQ